MRQAGRSLPEYRATKGTANILAAVARPDLAAELTLQPVRRYGVDAAILYSDIVVPVHAAGFGVEIVAGVGPVVERPFRTAADLDGLPPCRCSTAGPAHWPLRTTRPTSCRRCAACWRAWPTWASPGSSPGWARLSCSASSSTRGPTW